MLNARQAIAETIVGSHTVAQQKQKQLDEAITWAFETIKKATGSGRYACRLSCEWPLGGSAYTDRWSHEFAKKVALHIRGAGFKVKLVRLLVFCSWIHVSWSPEHVSPTPKPEPSEGEQ